MEWSKSTEQLRQLLAKRLGFVTRNTWSYTELQLSDRIWQKHHYHHNSSRLWKWLGWYKNENLGRLRKTNYHIVRTGNFTKIECYSHLNEYMRSRLTSSLKIWEINIHPSIHLWQCLLLVNRLRSINYVNGKAWKQNQVLLASECLGIPFQNWCKFGYQERWSQNNPKCS